MLCRRCASVRRVCLLKAVCCSGHEGVINIYEILIMTSGSLKRVDQRRFHVVLCILLLCGHLADARPGFRTYTPALAHGDGDDEVRVGLRRLAAVAREPGVPDHDAVRLSWGHKAGGNSVHEQGATSRQHQQTYIYTKKQRAPKNVQMLLDMPGDPTAGEVILQPLETWLLQPFGIGNSPFNRFDSFSGAPNRRRTSDRGNSMPALSARGSANLAIRLAFQPVAAFDVSIRLPLLPRTFDITLSSESSDRILCGTGLIYREQVVQCEGLATGRYTIIATDTDFGELQLAEKEVQISDNRRSEDLTIQLGMLLLEASFGSLAWPGVYARTRMAPLGSAIHAQIVGAQIVVYSKDQPDQIWDMQWTGDEGTAPFFLVPGSGDYIANMSVGDTLLQSQPVQFKLDTGYPSSSSRLQQPQMIELVAQQQLLCTGEVEDVRGESGSFPADIQQLQASGLTVFHPRGFLCRWELVPDYPELTLTINYAGLLNDESLMLYLGPNNVVKLEKPGEEDAGGVLQSTIWVERSIFVEFQTTRSNTSAVGSFSISWTSSSPDSKGVLTNRAMVVVLGCVSAAGAILAALCFYCVCCSRRRRGVVVVNSGTVADRVALLRVPSTVRELLPSKPYQPPEVNPLPGASTEPDCCAICLVEFEAAESVTVLPCMHFYHKDCIGSWLQRNCTCPLCKCNVLLAFQQTAQQQGMQQQQQQQRRHQQRPRHSQRHSMRRSSSSSSGDEEQTTNVAVTLPGSPAVELELSAGNGLQQLARNVSSENLATPATAASNGGAASADAFSSSNQYSRLPPLLARISMNAAAAAPNAVAPSALDDARTLRTPSPVASVLNPPSGTVMCDADDFAAAAAAAAAALAADTADQQAGATAGALSSAYEVAQASVSAVRASSRVWGRRLHGLLQPTSNGGGEASAAGAEQQHVVELRQMSASRLEEEAEYGSRQPVVLSPEVLMHVPRRGAISIYAYAGHTTAVEGEELQEQDAVLEQLEEQQQHLQTYDASAAAHGAFAAMASTSSVTTSGSHTADADFERSSRRQMAGLPGVTE